MKQTLILFTLLLLTSSAFAIETTDLQDYYKFDETSGSVAIDSLNDNNGTITNALVNQPGKINTSYYFDATSDYVTLANESNFDFLTANAGTWTISMWVKPETINADRILFSKSVYASDQGLYIRENASGAATPNAIQLFLLTNGSNYLTKTTPANSLTNGVWQLVTIRNNAGTISIDINGQTQALTTGGVGTFTGINTATQARIGALDSTTTSWKGWIDEIGIWKRALSGNDVNDLYNAGAGLTFPFSGTQANFDYTINKTESNIILEDNSYVSEGLILTDWNWYANGTLISDAQDYNYTTTQLTDLNICLIVDANNVTTYRSSKCYSFNTGDWTPPLTTFSSSQIESSTINTLTFTCTDNNSGCKWTTIKINDGDWNTWINTGTLDINYSGTGINTIQYFSTDNADNNETTKTSQFPQFQTTNEPSNSRILLQGVNQYNGYTVTNWLWTIDGTPLSGTTDQNKYYSTQANEDLNVCLTTNSLDTTCRSVNTWDTIEPTIDANITPSNYGFTSTFDINYNMICYDNFTPIQYTIQVNNGNTITTLYNSSDANASLKSGNYDMNVGQQAQFIFTCTDDSNNTATYTSLNLYSLQFRLINENTGAIFDLNKVTAAEAYSYDGNFIYDFKDANLTTTNFFSPSTTIRFDFTYPDTDATKISREINFDYIEDANIGVCVAEYQQFYLYRFLSTSVKPIVLFNDYAKCYNLASTTKFLYNTYQSNTAYTINKPYYLYTYDEGVKLLLALLDGANNTEINLDILAFNQQEYAYVVDMDGIYFAPNSEDENTVTFYFYSPNLNDSVNLQIYNGNTLLWTYTELNDTNNFEVNFFYGDLGVTDTNLLKVVVTVVFDGETSSFYKYFNTKAEAYSGILNPFVAIVLSFFIMFFGITMVSYRYAMGWFGLFISLVAIGVLALAPMYDYIIFLAAIYLIIGVFIGVIGKEQNLGVSN